MAFMESIWNHECAYECQFCCYVTINGPSFSFEPSIYHIPTRDLPALSRSVSPTLFIHLAHHHHHLYLLLILIVIFYLHHLLTHQYAAPLPFTIFPPLLYRSSLLPSSSPLSSPIIDSLHYPRSTRQHHYPTSSPRKPPRPSKENTPYRPHIPEAATAYPPGNPRLVKKEKKEKRKW